MARSTRPPRFPDRSPLLPAAAAFAVGIVVDRHFSFPPVGLFLLALLSTIAAVTLWRSKWPGTLCLVAALATLGALRHHQVWTLRGPEDLSRIDLVDDTPVRLVGVVESPVDVRRSEESPDTPAWMWVDRSSFNLRAERLVGNQIVPTSGLVRVDVSGHLPPIEIGDRIEVLGHIRIPGEPRDPEGFDLRLWLKSQGIDRAIVVGHPEGVVRLGSAVTLRHRLSRVRHSLRSRSEQVLTQNLGPDVRAVGTSLLLGTRAGLTNEIRDAFIDSGTMHLLAISGLHVAILAGLVLAVCRLSGTSSTWTVLIVVSTLWGYALVTDLRPPVLRSVVLGCLAVLALAGARQVSGPNLLAGTAFLLLLWNPGDLFDLGAQLSFLAVGAILWSTKLIAAWRRSHSPDPLAPESTHWYRAWKWMRDKSAEGYVVTAAIWLFTLPLTLAWFHLFAPIGFLVNVILVPFSGPLLTAGFATLGVGLLAPSLAWIPATAYDFCLRVLMFVVHGAAHTPFANVPTPGPAAWQLAVFYGLLFAAIVVPRTLWKRRLWLSLGIAVVVMLGLAVRPRTAADLVVSFLDVGHGGAVLFEFPGGQTALFDAGSFGRGDAAGETIQRALETRRITGLDALILSHADADHYNAAASLLQRFPVGVVYVSQAFPDMTQRSVSRLCETVVGEQLPLRIIQAGDAMMLRGECTLDVLHPSGGFRDRLDNAHSIVLRARFAGRTVLVTGDVEKSGVRALLETHPPGRIDVFQAPHHGGRMSNTTDLARWALPRYVVACNRDDTVLPHLKNVYADADRILTSASHGTVTATIRRNGEIELATTRGNLP
ncbi:ComEC/Rec2 family competence protein [Caulifigura coniformis]|uniref:ComEC/Rec2 family competence protein n=1 Tax=Caulifigura coniformis TaxID=2527983 RepID=UPI0018D2055A|nr:ComEC/Rec2 family competence protein [Caulifigura coniformis]